MKTQSPKIKTVKPVTKPVTITGQIGRGVGNCIITKPSNKQP
jgi:hypothetical protein